MSARARLIIGEVTHGLDRIPSDSVRCCITSPPYWGLRDYGHAGQIGLEPTPEEWADRLVAVFREVRRVLTVDGTLWLNLGDSYAGARRGGHPAGSAMQLRNAGSRRDESPAPRSDRAVQGLKAKDLIGQPWLLAFALRADGWYLRQEIIWHKPNPMPESAKDRPTTSHERIFLLSRSPRYYYGMEALTEEVSANTHMRVSQNVAAQLGSERANGGSRADRQMKAVTRDNGVGFGYADPNPKARTQRDRTPSGWDQRGKDESDHHTLAGRFTRPGKAEVRATKSLTHETGETGETGVKNNSSFAESVVLPVARRNSRTVWKIGTQAYKGAHFATFPEELARRCIVGGSEPGDTVLDPFGGSGTTARVAIANGRSAIHLDLVPEYTPLATHRIGPLLCDVEVLP